MKEIAYNIDLLEKAVSLIEKGKSKDEVIDRLEVGIATLYSWMRKKAAGESLKPGKWLFYKKNRLGNACRVRSKAPRSLPNGDETKS